MTEQIIRKIFHAGVFLFCMCTAVGAQDLEENRDLTDEVREWRNDTSALLTSPELIVGKNYISFLPVIGYAPANGFLLGAALSVSHLTAPSPTKMSSALINAQVTSKKQFIVNARSKVYLKNNEWFMQGDWRIMLFAQPTYGLGIFNSDVGDYLFGANNLHQNTLPEAEPMRFDYLRIYEDVVKQVGDKPLYVGLGLSIDHHYNIEDERLNTDTSSEDFYITQHYAYSVDKKFNPQTYITNGFNLNILTDTRDVICNPYSGYYGSFSIRVNPEIFRNSQYSIMSNYDVRYYIPLSTSIKRKVLAFWSWGTFVLDGNVPYLALPSVGWDTYNRSGRGYIQGRYRGINMVYLEAEYRFPISDNGLWGGVVFLNNTLASSPDQGLFDEAAPAMGAGLRLKMDKRARVNLTVDMAVGLDRSSGIYFGLQEAF
ncbi:MAG: BamA/TamA family outer membrane protein [Saprospiraceae bacterium]|nr:BamA/TamA family outer membrane protein [Saprospiraceae bacterium]